MIPRFPRRPPRATERQDEARRGAEALIAAAEDHIALAKTVGGTPHEAESVLSDARAAHSNRNWADASHLAKQAERLAMQTQQAQVERAKSLRDGQRERAEAIIAASGPILEEAESYGLNTQDAHTLLRQARDILSKGDSVGGILFARNAEEAVLRLGASIDEERRKRGIVKPGRGVCGACRSTYLHYGDDGWGRCLQCGSSFRWRESAGVLDTIRGFLGA